MSEYPILDGIAPSWADIAITITSSGAPLLEMKDIAAINTNTTVEVGEQRGASGGRVIRHTTGSKSDEASMTLYRSGYQKLLRNLMTSAPVDGNKRLISLVHFGVQVQHTPPNDVEIYEYRLKGCRLGGRAMNGAEGTDADQVEVPLIIKEIVDIIDSVEVVML